MKRIISAVGLLAALACACGGKAVIGSGKTDGGPVAGSGGSSGADAKAPPAPVAMRAKQNQVDKIDLVFMIDNSSSMSDKQAILAVAVPDLVDRLVSPVCVDPRNNYAYVAPAPAPGSSCPPGSEQDFNPVNSIHIGVVTSSLGGHGTNNCPDVGDTRPDAHNNDNGHLITRGDTSGATTTLGFLDYAAGKPSPNDATTVKTAFASIVTGVGQHGCGYEASLEAVYRFLVDPAPPTGVTIVSDANGTPVLQAMIDPPDATTLQQRKDFLRPDSLVAVVMITDENDCSLQDEGQAFLAISPATGTGNERHTPLMHGTRICETDPNNPCCYNCGVQTPPAGCPPASSDENCMLGLYKATEDPDNLRCFHMKQRYGIDFLYPVDRYVQAFTSPKIKNRSGATVQNPLFDDLKCPTADRAAGSCSPTPERDPALVYVAGIVGVPWQDIARDPTDLSKGYKTYRDMTATSTWPIILGDPTASPLIEPTDPLMIESVQPRTSYVTTQNPLGAAALPQPPTGTNPINGHEWNTDQAIPPNSDLQYACIFDLPTARDCTLPANARDCDCVSSTSPGGGTVQTMMNPLCQGASSYTTTQARAKAYPGIRQLQVLQGIGDQGIVASICPAKIQAAQHNDRDYGYRPAIYAVIDRLRPALRGLCQEETIQLRSDGTVPCVVYEAFNPDPTIGETCDCNTYPGREVTTDPSVIPDDFKAFKCICAIAQLASAADRAACQTYESYKGTPGWCYVDPVQQAGAGCALVRNCAPDTRRLIRFVGNDTQPGEPRKGSASVIICDPGTASSAQTADPCPY